MPTKLADRSGVGCRPPCRVFNRSARQWRRGVIDYLLAQLSAESDPYYQHYIGQALAVIAGLARHHPLEPQRVFADGVLPRPHFQFAAYYDKWHQFHADKERLKRATKAPKIPARAARPRTLVPRASAL